MPADIGGAVECLGSERRGGHQVIDAVIKTHRILRGIATATAAAGLVLGVRGFAENDPVAVLSSAGHEGFAGNPAGDSFAFGFLVGCAFFAAGRHQNGFHMNPVAGGIEDDQLVPALGFA